MTHMMFRDRRRAGMGDAPTSAISPRALAELARAGSSILRQPSMRIAFEVHHVRDRPGYLHDVLRGKYAVGVATADPPRFVEAIASAAYGVGVIVGTRTLEPESELLVSHKEHTPATAYPLDGRSAGYLFHGTAVPNVSFVQESGPVFEGLISIEVDPVSLQYRHCRAIRAVIEEISEVAAEVAGAPILSLQSPAQLPVHSYIGDDAVVHHTDWPRSSALAVRFSIGLDQPSAALRLRVADAFAEFCAQRGFGLWLADLRPGYRTGNWFAICRHDKNLVRTAFDGALDPKGASKVYSCLPITLVGPARVGATHAILQALSEYPRVGVVACTEAIIEDIAFIHLQLTVTGVPNSRLGGLNASLDEVRSVGDDPSVLLPRVLPLLVNAGAPGPAGKVSQRSAAGIVDYQMIMGPAFPLEPSLGENRRALWVSWEVEGREAQLRFPFLALCSALEDLGFIPTGDQGDAHPNMSPNVEYLICRYMGNSVLRGKGKLSFPSELVYSGSEDADRQAKLTSLSARVEGAWRDRLDKSYRARELTVSWREYWLGHWSLPLD
jgi:hypothetical protein